jgi:hypothetical protein
MLARQFTVELEVTRIAKPCDTAESGSCPGVN